MGQRKLGLELPMPAGTLLNIAKDRRFPRRRRQQAAICLIRWIIANLVNFRIT